MLLKIKKNLHDFENICQLHLISSGLLLITLFSEYVVKDFSFFGLVLFAFFSYLVRTYYFALKKLQYTFWTLTGFICFFLLLGLINGSLNQIIPVAVFLLMKIIELYFVSSPIFYPLFNWWEYDFRYRTDLKAFVLFNENSQEARVTDIRRNAACITLFEKLPIGSSIIVSMQDSNNSLNIEGKIISVRETSLGRGFSYGVSFSWDNELAKEYYGKMKNSWNKVRLENKRDKFDSNEPKIQ